MSSTKPYQMHEAMSVSVYVVVRNLPPDTLTGFDNPWIYRGPEAPRMFMEHVIKVTKIVQELYDLDLPMDPLTPQEQLRHITATRCHICREELIDGKYGGLCFFYLQK